MRYFFVDTLGESDPDLCILDRAPEGMGVSYYRMAEGMRAGNAFPEDARIHMSEGRTGLKMGSLVGNVKGYLILEQSAKEVVESRSTAETEYLPINVINHKGRVHGGHYYIVNPIGALDVLDQDKSDIDYFGEDKSRVLGVNRFVLDARKLGEVPCLFRIKEDPSRYVVREDLAKELVEKGFTNIVLTEIEQNA